MTTPARATTPLLLAALLLSAPSTHADEAKPATTAEPATAEPAKKERGPAENLVIEAGAGYGVGTLTTITNHSPQVVHGPTFHVGAGYAWTLRANQSIGVELFAQGMVDADRTTGNGAQIAGRYGASAFLVGERAHLRLGAGYATTTASDKAGKAESFSGLGISFAAGWHFAVGKQTGWKRAGVTFEVIPAWDFLSAGSETMHRLSFSMLLGVAIY